MEEPQPEDLLRGVFESVPDAVVVVDVDGRIVLANIHCRVVFGHEPVDLVGRPVEVLIPERFQDEHPRRRRRYDDSPDPRPMGLLRLSAVRADGSEFPAEISLAPIGVDGHHYVCATVRDISSRIRDEETFRSLLEGVPDPTVVIDASARIVHINQQVTEVLGFEHTDLNGRSLSVLASTPGPEEVLERITKYLCEPASVPMGYSQEFRVRHRDGHDLPVELSLSPLETPDGLLVSIALRDMTAQRHLEEHTQRQRDELIATVSHELRTPLTSIIGYAELMADLGDTDLSPRGRELLTVIERNAARELRLVDDLLTMAYLDDDRLRIQYDEVALDEVACRVVADSALRAQERGLALTLAVDAILGPVRGDFYRLVQVLENLVVNAIKFTDAGGRVEVTVADRDGRAMLVVADTGIGVTPEEQARLFERLYRAPSAIESQVQGAGLGLPIVHAIVEAHQGEVEVESEVGVGTTFRVLLPYADAEV